MSEEKEEKFTLLIPYGDGEEDRRIYKEEEEEEEKYKYKPKISEEVMKKIPEELFFYLSSSKVYYKNKTFVYINKLDKENKEDYKILNYLLVWAILFKNHVNNVEKNNVEKNNDIIINLQEKGAKLNTDYKEDSEIVRSVLRNVSFYDGEVIENIRKSIVPEITIEDWKVLIKDYIQNQESPKKEVQIRGAEKVQPQYVNPPTEKPPTGWFRFFSKPEKLSAGGGGGVGGGGGNPKQDGGFRKKHKNSKYKTKKFKKIYKKKKHNRKTRKYK